MHPAVAVPATQLRPAVFQLQGERDRLVVVGRRTDDNDRCELLLVAEVGGSFALYPHGAAQLGVRLAESGAVTVAKAILAAVESSHPANRTPPGRHGPA